MIANPNDDGANGGPVQLTFWATERGEDGGVRLRLYEVSGPVVLGVSSAAVPPELWDRFGDGDAGKGGA